MIDLFSYIIISTKNRNLKINLKMLKSFREKLIKKFEFKSKSFPEKVKIMGYSINYVTQQGGFVTNHIF